MAQRGSGLAARFRRAVHAEEASRERAEAERIARVESGRRAREQLFAELASFATETGFLEANRSERGVIFRWRDRSLHFVERGPADGVGIEFEGAPDEEHALYREPQLEDRWIWVRRRRGREDRVALFDKGLEELLVRALGLPRPDDGEPGERSL